MTIAAWIQEIIENNRDKTYPIPKIGQCYIICEDDKWIESKETIGYFDNRDNIPSSNIPMKKDDIIKIIGGQYYGVSGGLSNSWYWIRLLKLNKGWGKTQYGGYGGPWIKCVDPTLHIQKKALAKLSDREKRALGLK